MALAPQRLGLQELENLIALNRQQHRMLLLAIIAARQRRRQRENQRRPRRWWVKPWVERRREFGQYYTLLDELERVCEGDYQGYLRLDRNLFGEILLRVGARLTKSPRYVKYIIECLIFVGQFFLLWQYYIVLIVLYFCFVC